LGMGDERNCDFFIADLFVFFSLIRLFSFQINTPAPA
jgi:hypothetical protein